MFAIAQMSLEDDAHGKITVRFAMFAIAQMVSEVYDAYPYDLA